MFQLPFMDWFNPDSIIDMLKTPSENLVFMVIALLLIAYLAIKALEMMSR